MQLATWTSVASFENGLPNSYGKIRTYFNPRAKPMCITHIHHGERGCCWASSLVYPEKVPAATVTRFWELRCCPSHCLACPWTAWWESVRPILQCGFDASSASTQSGSRIQGSDASEMLCLSSLWKNRPRNPERCKPNNQTMLSFSKQKDLGGWNRDVEVQRHESK